jgi:hypothetical protein
MVCRACHLSYDQGSKNIFVKRTLMPNAAKRDHIARFPIEDLFMPVLDTDFRNGIEHHAAHYEQEHDAIVIFDTRVSTVSRGSWLPEFGEKVLDLFVDFELAVGLKRARQCQNDGHAQATGPITLAPLTGGSFSEGLAPWSGLVYVSVYGGSAGAATGRQLISGSRASRSKHWAAQN